jgi:ribosomal protein L37E
MSASLVKRVTAPFRRKRCPECGHKVHEMYCDVCGYDLIEQTRTKILRSRRSDRGSRQPGSRTHPSWHPETIGPEIGAG